MDTTSAPAGSATATGNINSNENAPVSGRIQLQPGMAFNFVRVSLPPGGPPASTDFLVDNITVGLVPELKLQLAAGNAVVSWPATESYVLQTSSDLGLTGWVDVTTGITAVGDTKQFNVGTPTGKAFFRLKQR